MMHKNLCETKGTIWETSLNLGQILKTGRTKKKDATGSNNKFWQQDSQPASVCCVIMTVCVCVCVCVCVSVKTCQSF